MHDDSGCCETCKTIRLLRDWTGASVHARAEARGIPGSSPKALKKRTDIRPTAQVRRRKRGCRKSREKSEEQQQRASPWLQCSSMLQVPYSSGDADDDEVVQFSSRIT